MCQSLYILTVAVALSGCATGAATIPPPTAAYGNRMPAVESPPTLSAPPSAPIPVQPDQRGPIERILTLPGDILYHFIFI